MGMGSYTGQMKNSNKIIFIVGNSRSGTTMLGRILDNHSSINTFGELHFFENQLDAITVRKRSKWPNKKIIILLHRLLTSSRDGLFSRVIPDKYKQEVENIVKFNSIEDPMSAYEIFLKQETLRKGKTIACEQTPRYLFTAVEILEALPQSRMINMIRDPRDVLLSQKNKWRRRFLGAKNIPLYEAFRAWVNYHPYTIARLWVSAVTVAHNLENHECFKSIYFEDLLKKPEEVVREICKFTEIEFEPSMLSVPQVGSSTGMDKPDQIGIDGSRIGGWRKGGLSELELGICQRVAATEMNRLGYNMEPVVISIWLRWFSMLTFSFKISVALLLNIKRSKNIIQSIRRRLVVSSKVY